MAQTAPRRADAERNAAAILDAALHCFNEGPDATMTDIAKAAGVGRVTVYGHFSSREELLDALLTRSLTETADLFGALGLDSGPADEALARLLRAPWLLDRYRGLYTAATKYLGPEKVRDLHETVFAPIQGVIERGRAEDAFRTDLPVDWQVATVYAIAHAARAEVDANRVSTEEAVELLTVTLLDLLRKR
jgi:AcrR family transcriptional regulator